MSAVDWKAEGPIDFPVTIEKDDDLKPFFHIVKNRSYAQSPFRSYRDVDGFFKQDQISVERDGCLYPTKDKDHPPQPGDRVFWQPRIVGMSRRPGLVVAVHSAQVDVLWGPWVEIPPFDVALRQLKFQADVHVGDRR